MGTVRSRSAIQLPGVPAATDETATKGYVDTAVAGAGSPVKALKLTADVANSTTTYANLTGLQLSLTAGQQISFRYVLLFNSAATTTGIGLGLNVANASVGYRMKLPLTNTTELVRNHNATALTAVATSSPYTTNNLAIIEGVVVATAATTLIPTFASEVAGSAITVKAGSSVMYF